MQELVIFCPVAFFDLHIYLKECVSQILLICFMTLSELRVLLVSIQSIAFSCIAFGVLSLIPIIKFSSMFLPANSHHMINFAQGSNWSLQKMKRAEKEPMGCQSHARFFLQVCRA